MIWDIIWPILCYDGLTAIVGSFWTEIGALGIQTVSALVTAAVLAAVWRYYGRTDRIWQGSILPARSFWYPLSLVLGVVCCLGLNGLVELSGLKQLFSDYTQVSEELFTSALWLQIVAMGAAIPLTEELIFRGFLYGTLRRYGTIPAAVVISSILFGLYHGNVVQGVYACLFSILLAITYEKSGALSVPVLIHGISNLTSVLVESYH